MTIHHPYPLEQLAQLRMAEDHRQAERRRLADSVVRPHRPRPRALAAALAVLNMLIAHC